MALGSRTPALREDYKTGQLCGRYSFATVGKLLAATLPSAPYVVTCRAGNGGRASGAGVATIRMWRRPASAPQA